MGFPKILLGQEECGRCGQRAAAGRPGPKVGLGGLPALCSVPMAADRGLWRAARVAPGHWCPREEALGPVLGLHRDPGLGDQAMALRHTEYPEAMPAGERRAACDGTCGHTTGAAHKVGKAPRRF